MHSNLLAVTPIFLNMRLTKLSMANNIMLSNNQSLIWLLFVQVKVTRVDEDWQQGYSAWWVLSFYFCSYFCFYFFLIFVPSIGSSPPLWGSHSGQWYPKRGLPQATLLREVPHHKILKKNLITASLEKKLQFFFY